MKRFTETTKWLDPWFRKLSGQLKLLWNYLCDNCDATGLIDFDIGLASQDLGFAIQPDWSSAFGDRIQVLEGGKIFLTKFIDFQYGELSQDCPPHKKILKQIKERGLTRVPLGYFYSNSQKQVPTRQEEDKKGKEEDKKGESEGEFSPPARPYTDYPALAAECDRLFARFSKLPQQPQVFDRIWFDLLRKHTTADVEIYLRWVVFENHQREEVKYRIKFHVPKMFSNLEEFAANLSLAKAWYRNLPKAATPAQQAINEFRGFEAPPVERPIRSASEIIPAVMAKIKPKPTQ